MPALELIGVVALTATVEFLLSQRKWLMFATAASLVTIAIAALPILADFYPESRTIFLFLDYSDDLSKIERTRMLDEGWNSIQQNPGWERSAATGPATYSQRLVCLGRPRPHWLCRLLDAHRLSSLSTCCSCGDCTCVTRATGWPSHSSFS